ncbi:MAG: MlaD family protein [Phycisphaerales bacterium]
MGRASRNNVLAGGLVLGAIGASLGVVTVLGGWYEKLGKARFTAVFDISEGVPGLKPGAEVRLGGLKVGQVESVSPRAATGDKPAVMEVKLLLDKRMAPLRQGALVYLEQGLLGSISALNFKSLGDAAAPELVETIDIDGVIAAPSILESAGYGDKQKSQVQNIIDRVESTVLKAESFMAKAEAEVDAFKGKRDAWYTDVDAMMTNGREMIATANKETPGLIERINKASDEAKQAFADARAAIEENRPALKSAIEQGEAAAKGFNELGERLRNQTVKLVEEMIAAARAKTEGALDTLQTLLGRADSAVAENVPQVRATMAKLRLSGDQLASTLAEVRRSPWRLLYRPDTRDLEFELLYDSARVYAQAVSDVGSATDALKGLKDSGGGVSDGGRSVSELTRDLGATVDRLKEAEGEFLRQLKAKAK